MIGQWRRLEKNGRVCLYRRYGPSSRSAKFTCEPRPDVLSPDKCTKSVLVPRSSHEIGSLENREQLRRNKYFDTASDSGLPSNPSLAFEGEHHLVYRR